MDEFKWGIIGPGNIAIDFASDLSLIAAIPQRVSSILSHTIEGAENFVKKFPVDNNYTAIQDFVKSGIDAVYIATPHTLHYEEAKECLRHKIPVLCEKPITINTAQLNDLINMSREQSVFLMEGMWIRFLPSIKQVMKLIGEDKIGRIISVKANLSYRAPYDKDSRYFNPDLGGGSLLDLGIYPVFLATLLLGKPASIKAAAVVSAEGIDEACSILLNYTGNQYAVLESSLITQFDSLAEIDGEKGRITIRTPWNETPAGILLEFPDDKTQVEFPCEWEGRGFQYEIAEVLHCLQNKKIESELMPLSLSLQVMEIMDEVRKQVNVKYEKYE